MLYLKSVITHNSNFAWIYASVEMTVSNLVPIFSSCGGAHSDVQYMLYYLSLQITEPDLSNVYLAYTAEGAAEALRPRTSKGKSGRPKTASRPKTSKK